MPHREWHRTERVGWLRAAVLGANDGIVSTASLIVGVAAAQATSQGILVAGVVADLVLSRLRPHASSRDLHVFALVLPVLFYAAYFALVA